MKADFMTVALTAGIQLYSGAFFNYSDPDSSDVTIQDIARALSHVCRFAGHVDRHYSIAQHSINVSHLVPPQFAYDALMHDMSEAFTGDIPTPLKTFIPQFKELELRIEEAMAKRFAFKFPLPAEVKLADLQMLKIEKEHLKPYASGDWEVLEGISITDVEHLADMDWWTSDEAYAGFIDRYEELR
jgi:hypothetical protein